MMIKVFTTNENGKIELTKDELRKLLDEAYWEGYYKNHDSSYIYTTPTINWSSDRFTATPDININTISSTAKTTSEN